MRLQAAMLFAGLLALSQSGSCENPLEERLLSTKIRPSLVKIDIVFRDRQRRILGPKVPGQGVRVSPDGHILTALHVVLPTDTEFMSRNAVSYELHFSEFTMGVPGRDDTYKSLAVSLPQDIRQISSYDTSLDNSSLKPCNESSLQPCMHSRIEAGSDLIVIDSGASSDAFIDMVGPYDLEAAFEDMNVGVVSDFHGAENLNYYKLDSVGIGIKDHTREKLLQAGSNDIFYDSVSGSPVIAWRNGKNPGLVVIGVVSSNRSEDKTKNRCKVAMISTEFSASTMGNLRKDDDFISLQLPSWQCTDQNSTFPGPRTIVRDYILINTSAGAVSSSYDMTIDCGKSLSGWRNSFKLLEHGLGRKSEMIISEIVKAGAVSCSDGSGCTVGSGSSPLPIGELSGQFGEARMKKVEAIQRFVDRGGIYRQACAEGDRCDEMKSFISTSSASDEELRRIQKIGRIEASIRSKLDHSTVDLLAAKVATDSFSGGARPDELLFLYGLRVGRSAELSSLERLLKAIRDGESVSGLSDSTRKLLRSGLRSVKSAVP